MCGRLDLNEIAALLPIRLPGLERYRPSHDWPADARYNVPPSAVIPVAIEREGVRQVSERVWGPGTRIGGRWKQIINAKLDRLTASPMWRPAMVHGRRGVVVARGYYEWQQRARGAKQPYYVRRRDGRPLTLAALYGYAPVRADGDKQPTAVVVTRQPCGGLEQIHSRMPLELPDEYLDQWLDPEGEVDVAALEALNPAAAWEWWPVSTRANSPANDDECVTEAVYP